MPTVEQKLTNALKVVESTSENDDDDLPSRATITRPRDESPEEKKARKQAVKADRQARRLDKRFTKEQFSKELKNQMKGITNKEKTKMRKL
jgi:protein LTV1